jgi:lipopolysaccharide/colanic/teichoic acid biosynthesis glycosyltransferase
VLGHWPEYPGSRAAPLAIRPGSPSEVARTAVDAGIAAIALVVAMPLMLLIAAIIKLGGRGPVIFRQRRLGRDGEAFTMLKFRTMAADAPAGPHREYIAELSRGLRRDGDELKKLTSDARVTKAGAVLRRFSLDELPQLFNVLRGEMALVGPRPALDYELRHYRPEHFERFARRPGLTGLWQVSGRARLGFQEMLELDVEYVRHQSLHLDLWILARTPRALVGGTA